MDERGEASDTHEMTSSRTHAPGAEGAPLLASDRESTHVKPPLGRADRDRVSSARVVGGVAIALLVACVGAFGSIAVAARASGAAGAVVTSPSALGSVSSQDSAVDPKEASGARPMSAYGTIDEHSPVMRDLAAGEDPVERAASAFLADATLGEREERDPARDDDDASRNAENDAPRDPQPEPRDPQPRTPSSPASAVQADVDDQIEVEMRRLDRAARAMDDERAMALRARADGAAAADAETTTRLGSRSSRAAEKIQKTDARASSPSPAKDGDVARSAKKHRRSSTSSKSADAVVAANTEDAAPNAEDATKSADAARAMDAQPVVSEVKDGYARAVDAALASGSSRSAEPASSVPEPLSALNVLEASATTVADGSAAETRGVGVVREAAPFAAAAACDFARCDAAAGPQVVDETCVSLGGLGCIGKTGCRFCKAGGVGEPGLANCPPCVCQAMGVGGCASGGGVASSYGAIGAAEKTATTDVPYANDFDGGVPVDDVATRVVAAPAALTTEGATRASPEALALPEETQTPAPTETSRTPFSVDGVAWLLTPFGYLESCESRCARAKMRCDDTKFPTTFQDFVSVVGATTPEAGRDDVCVSVLETDPSRHCVFPLYALSGRCYQQPARAPSCVTAEDSHADCQHFCPCVA